ncbi:hypothetical protein QUA54_13490 [Microcoleus sp. MOSTC5]|uniref:hypothetical protein n=1 Tax=Microcoleus sp. MOSTC5 TaxID=3055378 RepID=UPI002FD330EA
MDVPVDVIFYPVLFEEEDTGLVELAIALEDEVVYIFNPRQQRWNTHFAWNGVEAIGLTAIEQGCKPLISIGQLCWQFGQKRNYGVVILPRKISIP